MNGAINGEDDEQQRSYLTEVDVLYGSRNPLVYDPKQGRYVKGVVAHHHQHHNHRDGQASSVRRVRFPLVNFYRNQVLPRLQVAFLPSGVTSNYYRFVQWRVLQRFIDANLHVLGTRGLLLGLGIKAARSSSATALSAALNWVLKDALGKMARMLWASKMGRRFDSDAKRWRFRSAFVFAAGNGLEIITAQLPRLFLVTATAANCCKQVSMLTSSSTRTAIYNSFRDGTRENIGDITAKGEAQIAFVDLAGIASGVALTRALGTASIWTILAAYVVLQAAEVACMYRQLRAVEYRVLNFERMVQVMTDYCESYSSPLLEEDNPRCVAVVGNDDRNIIPTPEQMARQERIFLPPRHLARRSMAFGSFGRAKLSPTELEKLFEIFSGERFILVVGQNVKKRKLRSRFFRRQPRVKKQTTDEERIKHLQENCHIVLHSEATNVDIVKSTLALVLLRRHLSTTAATTDRRDPDTIRTADCYGVIETSLEQSNRMFPTLLQQMSGQGWESPARFMFGRVHMRAEWPVQRSARPQQKPQASTQN